MILKLVCFLRVWWMVGEFLLFIIIMVGILWLVFLISLIEMVVKLKVISGMRSVGMRNIEMMVWRLCRVLCSFLMKMVRMLWVFMCGFLGGLMVGWWCFC